MPVASKDLNLLSDGGMHSLYYLVTQDSVTDVEKPDYFKAVQPQLRANDLIIVNCRGPQGTRAVGFFLVTVSQAGRVELMDFLNGAGAAEG